MSLGHRVDLFLRSPPIRCEDCTLNGLPRLAYSIESKLFDRHVRFRIFDLDSGLEKAAGCGNQPSPMQPIEPTITSAVKQNVLSESPLRMILSDVKN